MENIVSIDVGTIGIVTFFSLLVNAITIYRWVADYLQRESLNDQAFHMLMGLANSLTKRIGMIVRRMDILKAQDRVNDESMIFLENMWADSMAATENLLAAAKALKPKSASSLPYNADELLRIAAEKSKPAK